MSEIREIILKEMRKQKLTTYQLSQMLKGKMPQRTLYAFLKGSQDTTSDYVSKILKVLGLKIVKENSTTTKRGKSPRKGINYE
jgi:predicted transcriptional regulator